MNYPFFGLSIRAALTEWDWLRYLFRSSHFLKKTKLLDLVLTSVKDIIVDLGMLELSNRIQIRMIISETIRWILNVATVILFNQNVIS